MIYSIGQLDGCFLRLWREKLIKRSTCMLSTKTYANLGMHVIFDEDLSDGESDMKHPTILQTKNRLAMNKKWRKIDMSIIVSVSAYL